MSNDIDLDAVWVKPVAVWESGTQKLLGYYPGIFGVVTATRNKTLFYPALKEVNADPIKPLAGLYATGEEAMHAWENATPIEMPDGLAAAQKIHKEAYANINRQELYRSLK